MANSWRPPAAVRDITVHKGEDLELSGRFARQRLPWTPPEDTAVFFRVFRSPSDGGELDIVCAVDGDTFSVHVESSVADTFTNGCSFWFFVATPETTGGKPKVITTGRVFRVDP
ncbi:hypothetical protein SEA_VANLEE_24 [Gordonia phage VanLee]|uniref:LtfC/p132/Gp6 beta-sandwich domain-containing protein n=1 Tax=Gordonia phage VanLee TaxID=2845816 RepID=A0A8F2IFG2_9CAUD|nr:hypothetical protein QEH49_gp024 [Gordonia phage VanLee]QWS68142.1 hypothetical protein SEA_VANLEE_24 [Gordonia phage VanLee]